MIHAVGKRLIVKELKKDDSEGKEGRGLNVLIIPNKKEQVEAVIIDYGMEIEAPKDMRGMIVILMPDTGIPIEIDGEEYLSIVENQVLAIMEKK